MGIWQVSLDSGLVHAPSRFAEGYFKLKSRQLTRLRSAPSNYVVISMVMVSMHAAIGYYGFVGQKPTA
jgi:hypothetical protein